MLRVLENNYLHVLGYLCEKYFLAVEKPPLQYVVCDRWSRADVAPILWL